MTKRLVLALLVACAMALVAPQPAGAHGQGFPTAFFPEDGGVVADPPSRLEVEFSITPISMSASMSNAVGESVGITTEVDGSTTVTLTPDQALAPGIWLVSFDVEFDHPDHGASTVAGGWTFVVGSGGELGDVPPLDVDARRWDGLASPFSIVGYLVSLAGVGAVIAANRHRPQLAGVAALIVVLGLAPAVSSVVTAEEEPVLDRTDGVTTTIAIEPFGDVAARLEPTGPSTWSLEADFTEERPVSVRVWAAVVEPTSDAGGSPVNQLAFIDTDVGGRYTLDFELDAPGRWQIVLLPADVSFQSSQGAFWVDQP